MADRPILFSAPMVRALIEGRKNQTRRIIKNVRRDNCITIKKATKRKIGLCTHVIDAGQVGLLPFTVRDRLWVRETWADLRNDRHCDLYGKLDVAYRASDDDEFTIPPRWKPSTHMPRAHSRLTLLVTEVRVERLQDISEADARAEGIEPLKSGRGFYDASVGKGSVRAGIWHHKATEAYAALWNHINGPGAWEANPWVVAVSFTVQQCNIDQMPGGAA